MERNIGSNDLVFSYLTLRKVIGILGIALPFVVSLGAIIFFKTEIQSSISSYYHTGMRDYFVGTLFVIGFFLLAYRGYERTDDIAGDIAWLSAVGIALFPTTAIGSTTSWARLIGNFHLAFSAVFFLTLAYFSLFLFTKTNPNKPPTKRKLQRNKIYRACGYTMSTCIVLMAIYAFFPGTFQPLFENIKPIYWLEALAIFAFGVSWFTKSEAILKDEN
jgi:hypothetical protein